MNMDEISHAETITEATNGDLIVGVTAAAKFLKVSRKQFYNYLGSDDPPPHEYKHGRCRFSKKDLKKWYIGR